MFWRKKPSLQSIQKSLEKEKKELIKPSPRKRIPRAKRIVFELPCYLLVNSTQQLIQTQTINLSRTGILVKSLHLLENGQEILCLISDKRNLTSAHVRTSPHTLKARIVRVEKELMMYKLAIQVTMGRVNPLAYLGNGVDDKSWWTRHWQSMDTMEE